MVLPGVVTLPVPATSQPARLEMPTAVTLRTLEETSRTAMAPATEETAVTVTVATPPAPARSRLSNKMLIYGVGWGCVSRIRVSLYHDLLQIILIIIAPVM